MADCQPIYAEITEETISVSLEEETILAEVFEEVLSVEITEETISVSLEEETINTEIVEEVINAEIACLTVAGASGQVFVTEITSSGIVGNIQYAPNTVPIDAVVLEVTVDSDDVTIHFMAEGGLNYSPTVTVGGVVCTNLQQYTNDRRLFYGSVTLSISSTTTVLVSSSTGDNTSVIINRAAAGPEVLTCIIGSYPTGQTAAKENDTINVTGTVETEATEIKILAYGAFKETAWISVFNGTFDIIGHVSNLQGTYDCKVQARNSLGTTGNEFTSTNTIILDQTIPQFIDNGITYPASQSAFKNTETGSQDTTISDFTSVLYSSPNGDFSITSPTIYEQNKTIQLTNPNHYNDSTINFRIVATKSSNGTTATFNKIIEVADIAPIVTVTQPQSRLRSSAAGESYQITATSNQNLSSAPDLNVPVSGAWQGGGFTGGAKIWHRNILIVDSDAKGSAAWGFNGAAPTNNAGLSATINGNEVVGGFIERTLTIDAWPNRETDIGTNVSDVNKLVCENLSKGGSAFNGGTIFTYDGDLDNELDKFTITSPFGIVNINGNLWYNKDQANAVSNTSGTAKVIIREDI